MSAGAGSARVNKTVNRIQDGMKKKMRMKLMAPRLIVENGSPDSGETNHRNNKQFVGSHKALRSRSPSHLSKSKNYEPKPMQRNEQAPHEIPDFNSLSDVKISKNLQMFKLDLPSAETGHYKQKARKVKEKRKSQLSKNH